MCIRDSAKLEFDYHFKNQLNPVRSFLWLLVVKWKMLSFSVYSIEIKNKLKTKREIIGMHRRRLESRLTPWRLAIYQIWKLRWPTTVTSKPNVHSKLQSAHIKFKSLTSNSNRSHQIQIAHSKFKSATANSNRSQQIEWFVIRCEWFEFAVSDLNLLWAIWIWCERFVICCEHMVLMWQLWATVVSIFGKSLNAKA